MYEYFPDPGVTHQPDYEYVLLDPDGIKGINNSTYYPFVGEELTAQGVYTDLNTTRLFDNSWYYQEDTNILEYRDAMFDYKKLGQVKVYKEEFVPAFSYTDASSFENYLEFTCFERVPKFYTKLENNFGIVFIPSELSPPVFNKSKVMISGSLPSASDDYVVLLENLSDDGFLLKLIKFPISDSELENPVIYETKTLSNDNMGTLFDVAFMPELELPE